MRLYANPLFWIFSKVWAFNFNLFLIATPILPPYWLISRYGSQFIGQILSTCNPVNRLRQVADGELGNAGSQYFFRLKHTWYWKITTSLTLLGQLCLLIFISKTYFSIREQRCYFLLAQLTSPSPVRTFYFWRPWPDVISMVTIPWRFLPGWCGQGRRTAGWGLVFVAE